MAEGGNSLEEAPLLTVLPPAPCPPSALPGSLKWGLQSSCRRSSAASRGATRRSCSRPHCPRCWWSSPGLVSELGGGAWARGLVLPGLNPPLPSAHRRPHGARAHSAGCGRQTQRAAQGEVCPCPWPGLCRALSHPLTALSLQTSFFLVREDTKAAVLLHLLRNVVRPQDQTVVFVATKHHAEYLSEVSGPGW